MLFISPPSPPFAPPHFHFFSLFFSLSFCSPAHQTTHLKFLDGAPSVYQGVYVREKGALIYGLADTPYVYPVAGEETPNWSYTPGTEYGNLYAQPLNSDVTKGFLACPSGKNFTGPWQVFADLEGLKDSDVTGGKLCECLPIDIITSNTTDGDGVYQYV